MKGSELNNSEHDIESQSMLMPSNANAVGNKACALINCFNLI